jgi:hypothetical protein
MTCDALRHVASELALDMLNGEERAAALGHLETCGSCRVEVALLTDAAEALLLLAPEVAPSAGFDQRVVARIERLAAPGEAVTVRIRRRWHPPWRGVLAAAAVVLIVAAGLLVTGSPSRHELAAPTAEMRTGTGQVVGDVSLTADPPAIALTIPDWIGLIRTYGATVDAPYWLSVQTDDGRRDLYRLPSAEDHPWTVPIQVDPHRVTAVSLIDDRGEVWCRAQFA